jgi:hypothetical protein
VNTLFNNIYPSRKFMPHGRILPRSINTSGKNFFIDGSAVFIYLLLHTVLSCRSQSTRELFILLLRKNFHCWIARVYIFTPSHRVILPRSMNTRTLHFTVEKKLFHCWIGMFCYHKSIHTTPADV